MLEEYRLTEEEYSAKHDCLHTDDDDDDDDGGDND